MITSEQIDIISGALWAAIDTIANTPITKSKENPFFGSKYLDLDTIKATVDPILANYSLYITQWPDETSNGEPALTTLLIHRETGQFFKATAAMALSKKDPQAQGSALTYMKRYAYVAILGIRGVDADDDGNLASQPDRAVTRSGAVATDARASRGVAAQRTDLEHFAVGTLKWSKPKLTKWYHDSFGVDYKSDTDEQNLAAAIAKLALEAK